MSSFIDKVVLNVCGVFFVRWLHHTMLVCVVRTHQLFTCYCFLFITNVFVHFDTDRHEVGLLASQIEVLFVSCDGVECRQVVMQFAKNWNGRFKIYHLVEFFEVMNVLFVLFVQNYMDIDYFYIFVFALLQPEWHKNRPVPGKSINGICGLKRYRC